MATDTQYIRGELLSESSHIHDYHCMDKTSGSFQTITQITDLDESKVTELVQTLSQLASKKLQHPNITSYLGYSKSASSSSYPSSSTTFTILSEYEIGQRSLAFYIKEHGKLEAEPELISNFTRQILEGLVYLHQEGINIANLNTSDIFIDLDGLVKITHYGFPIALKESVLGTPSNPPESPTLVSSDKADIWALGGVVLEMFCGYSPWNSIKLEDIPHDITRKKEYFDIHEDIRKYLDQMALAFVTDCLTFDPASRPTASTFLNMSPFCAFNAEFNFEHTDLYRKIVRSIEKERREDEEDSSKINKNVKNAVNLQTPIPPTK